jgi:hypothetical protein
MKQGLILMFAGAMIGALGVLLIYEFKLCRCAPQFSLLCRQSIKKDDDDVDKYII